MGEKTNDSNRFYEGTASGQHMNIESIERGHKAIRSAPLQTDKEIYRDIKIEELESSISTLTLAVDYLQSIVGKKVDKDDIIASINTSDEDVRIQGSKLIINGETIKSHVTP